MKHKYKPGDIFVIQNKQAGNFTDELIVIVEPTETTSLPAAHKYKVLTQSGEVKQVNLFQITHRCI